ncbi:hypothetical protein HDIA_4163 [Hartmannibacter diazotrophicus]|uniref:Uncharacterized protein n=1 Tax=Hartmannibacter diazotrophicus TaxID=1482074 RepID=A0A2C9DBK5_9HYPH|nr:hypothetical protein HDIA_4163 [Hartmannibacter diazotrophicus]
MQRSGLPWPWPRRMPETRGFPAAFACDKCAPRPDSAVVRRPAGLTVGYLLASCIPQKRNSTKSIGEASHIAVIGLRKTKDLSQGPMRTDFLSKAGFTVVNLSRCERDFWRVDVAYLIRADADGFCACGLGHAHRLATWRVEEQGLFSGGRCCPRVVVGPGGQHTGANQKSMGLRSDRDTGDGQCSRHDQEGIS